MTPRHTRDELLDIALELVQTRGYNAFSFRDIANRVGIKTASIHYHFPTKEDLARAVVSRHREVVTRFLSEVDANGRHPLERLFIYCDVFRSTLANGHRMCLGGMLAIESQSLPRELVREVRDFYEINERWLTRTLQAGREAGLLEFSGPAESVARTLFDALEGAMLAARAFGDSTRLDVAIDWHLSRLKSPRV